MRRSRRDPAPQRVLTGWDGAVALSKSQPLCRGRLSSDVCSQSRGCRRPLRHEAPRAACALLAAREMKAPDDSLLARLARGPVLCGEGYLFELERRGYLRAGPFVPEVVLDRPEVVERLHRDFVHAGSDVVETLTYYGHRAKLRAIGKEQLVEPLNRQALRIARSVAEDTNTLLAGNISNTEVYDPSSSRSEREVRGMFDEQVAWAAEAGVDFIIGETFEWLGEALLALEAIRSSGKPAVLTLAIRERGVSAEGIEPDECCRRLEQAGGDVVGLNCNRGPTTMLPLIREIRRAVSCPVAALPVPYRTIEAQPIFQTLQDPSWTDFPNGRPFPTGLDPFVCNRYEMAAFAKAAYDMNIRYLGACCGAGPHHLRAMAMAVGRAPEAARYEYVPGVNP